MIASFDLASVAGVIGGKLSGGDVQFNGVSIDTRTLQAGDLFFAIKGAHFDGIRFVAEAERKGAGAVVVSDQIDTSLPVLRVADTPRALGALANCNRRRFKYPLIGITGSAGKTTAKNILAAIAARSGATLATQGNLNNEIGVPLTILSIDEQHRYAVVEMGAAKKGDIAYLCEIAEPDIAVLLNAMSAHLSGFGSIDGVAAAKGEIFLGLGAQSTAVINADSPYAELWREYASPANILQFAVHAAADLSASDIKPAGDGGTTFNLCTPWGNRFISFRLLGEHNIMNALAAAAAALAAGIDLDVVEEGLHSVNAVQGRLFAQRIGPGYLLIDDSYNASPEAVKAAIDVLAEYRGRKFLLLGDMAELGTEAEALHGQIGSYAREKGVDYLWTVGELSYCAAQAFGSQAKVFSRRDEMSIAAGKVFCAGDTVLVKGSRSAAMDQVIDSLKSDKNNKEGF